MEIKHFNLYRNRNKIKTRWLKKKRKLQIITLYINGIIIYLKIITTIITFVLIFNTFVEL